MSRLPVTASSLGRSPQLFRQSIYRVPKRAATQWAGGRPKEAHVVNRKDANDVQAEAAQSAMKQKKEGKEGSQAISEKDEGKFNKAKEDHPEAPTPVIGCVPDHHLSNRRGQNLLNCERRMNDERAEKGHK
jgi:hypothetical protein